MQTGVEAGSFLSTHAQLCLEAINRLLTSCWCCTRRLIGSIAIIGTLAAPLRQLVITVTRVMSPFELLPYRRAVLTESLAVFRQRALIGTCSRLICRSGWQRTKTGSPSGAVASPSGAIASPHAGTAATSGGNVHGLFRCVSVAGKPHLRSQTWRLWAWRSGRRQQT